MQELIFNEIKEIENSLIVLEDTFRELGYYGSEFHLKTAKDYIDTRNISEDEKQRLRDRFLTIITRATYGKQ